VVALGLVAITYVATAGGFIDASYGPVVLVGIALGLVGALAATSAAMAAIVAAAVGLVGGLVSPPEGAGGVIGAFLLAAVAGAVAYAVAWALESGALRRPLVVLLGTLLVIGSLWLTTAAWGPRAGTIEGMSTFQFLATPPAPGAETNDQAFYLSVYYRMKQGSGYYDAFSYVSEAKRMGIRVLPPDINTSGWDFSIEDQPASNESQRRCTTRKTSWAASSRIASGTPRRLKLRHTNEKWES